MVHQLIKPMDEEFVEYLRDESRTVGNAESISFPKTESDIVSLVKELSAAHIPVTVQGGRTGLAAAAVPFAGHILNLMRMNAVTGMRCDAFGRYYLKVQPGVVLSQLRKMLETRKFDAASTALWDEESHQVFTDFARAPEQFFSPDPTEASATIGGMIACNASGARSYMYGPVRPYINALRVVLANGDTLSIRRGEIFANGRHMLLTTEQGNKIDFDLPTYIMPATKNASGYYIADDMDAVDLFIGSDGTMGIISEAELTLLPLPEIIWGVSCMFTDEMQAVSMVEKARQNLHRLAAIEFFDVDALAILRRQRGESTAFAALPMVDERISAVVYVEIHADNEEQAYQELFDLGVLIEEAGGNEADTWVARTAADRDRLVFFRHAVPESVNMLIDKRKKTNPTITKLGTDMSAPDNELVNIMKMYRSMLTERGLQSAIWGHIGNNHLHVNILPRDAADQAAGKELYAEWAAKISAIGGAVSAEHGVGKLKARFLEIMYGSEHIAEMADLKRVFDPQYLLGRENLFSAERFSEGGEA